MSLKYRIPVMLSIVFSVNIFLLFLFIFFYTVPDLREGIEHLQNQAEDNLDKIVEGLEGKSYGEALLFLQEKVVEDGQLSFMLEDIETKEQTFISKQREDEMYFSAVRSLDLVEGCYVLLLQSDINMYYSLDGTLLRLTMIEFFVLLASFIIIACIMNSRYVRPLKKLTVEIEQFHKTETLNEYSKRTDEIGSLEKGFFRLARGLRKEKENQNRIIASISHDIKTPLTSIMGFSERLAKKDLEKEKQASYLKSIYRQSKNIEGIIEEFDEYLSFSMNGSLTLQKLDVSFVCELLEDEYTDICANKGVLLIVNNQCPLGSSVNIDGAKMRRVFANLIGNAMRHNNNEGLEIHIVFINHSNHLQITVSDNGRGVSESDMAYIFEPFYTSDKSRKMSGLGLSICAQIIKIHGGNICALNKDNGFAVQILLPLL